MSKNLSGDIAELLENKGIDFLDQNYVEVQRCFPECFQDFGTEVVSEKESDCIGKCFGKYYAAGTFLSQKHQYKILRLIVSDPRLKENN
jgi:hypothetical protein